MFKLKYGNKDINEVIKMSELKPCEIAVIVDEDYPAYKDVIVMRTASASMEVMNLSKPSSGGCWSNGYQLIKVKRLPVGTEVTLIVT